MTPEEFCLWMQGFIDGNGVNIISTAQLKEIKRKLNEVDYEPAMDFEVAPNGEIFETDNGHMIGIWTRDIASAHDFDQVNIDYIER